MENKFLTFPFEIKAIDDTTGRIEGYASVFNNVDLGLDVVIPGAFKRTLRNTKGKVPVLADHDPYSQIGWGVEASEDDHGLNVAAELDIQNNQKAREKYSLAKKAKEIGAKSGMSIGYMTVKSEPNSENPGIRELKELKLMEYSLVTFPMNPEAIVTSAKNWVFNQGSIEKSVAGFVAAMVENGYSNVEILKHIESVIGKDNPSQVAHLFQSAIGELKSLKRK